MDGEMHRGDRGGEQVEEEREEEEKVDKEKTREENGLLKNIPKNLFMEFLLNENLMCKSYCKATELILV